MGSVTEILVLPFFGQGHLFPCAELCKHFSSLNCKSILIIPSHLSSSIPSDLHHHPLVELIQISSSSPSPNSSDHWSGPGPKPVHYQLGQGIKSFLSERFQNVRPAFVVVDVMMTWSKEIFKKANIPIVSFFTSGACATTMVYAAWKAHVENIDLDESNRMITGLPESMALTFSDAKRRERRKGSGGGGRSGGNGGMNSGGRSGGNGMNSGGRSGGNGMNSGTPRLGLPTRWLDETEGSTALLINTCDDLEAPFLKYLNSQVEKPVFGVGPLLPETFWESIGSVVHDRDSRPNKATNYTEDEVIQWLDSKPPRSVIYVSFGSEVGPSMEEYQQIADAFAESNQSFIWVIQPGAGRPGPPANMFGADKSKDSKEDGDQGGYEPHGLEERVGKRGLIIKGWAPQLSILSHVSTGGFLSHCGWNSTVEAIACGVPILAWPIRGDQFYDAKLVVKYLNVGHMVPNADDVSKEVNKMDVMRGIQVLMDDEEARGRAAALRGVFKDGYPSSSAASLKALIQLLTK